MTEDRLLDLRYWLGLLLRHRWMLIGSTLGVMLLALFFSSLQLPIYRSGCSLYLRDDRVKPLSFKGIYDQTQAWRTDPLLEEIEIIKSRSNLKAAVMLLEESGHLDFNDSESNARRSWLVKAFDGFHWGSEPKEVTPAFRRRRLIRSLKLSTTVKPTGGNAFLVISVRNGDPNLAAKLSNAIADAYLRRQEELAQNRSKEAITWLMEKVDDQRVALVAAEEELKRHTISTEPKVEEVGELAMQEINRMQDALLDVRLKLVEVESQSLLASDPSDEGGEADVQRLDDVKDEVSRALRVKVRDDLVDSSVELNQLRQRYGEKHPDVIQMAEKVRQLREEFARLPAPPPDSVAVLTGQGNVVVSTLEILRSQESSLRENLNKLREVSQSQEKSGLQLAILQREVEIARSLYNEVLSRLNEVTISSGLESNVAEIFELAVPRGVPISPNRPRHALLGAIAGLLLGFASAAVKDYLDQSVRDPAHANDLLKAPVLGIIPQRYRKAVAGPDSLQPLSLGQGSDMDSAEAYRILRAHIEGAVTQEEGKILLLTSAVPGEGKSTTSANLAAAFAEAGDRVLLIDGDRHRGSLGRYFHFNVAASLSQVLSDDLKPELAIRDSGLKNLDFLGCRAGDSFPEGARLKESVRTLFGWAREHYDRILVDMPVVMMAPEVTQMGRAGATILLVHRPGTVPAHVLESVREHLAMTKSRLVGVVLNGVHARWMHGAYPYPYKYETTDPRPSRAQNTSAAHDAE